MKEAFANFVIGVLKNPEFAASIGMSLGAIVLCVAKAVRDWLKAKAKPATADYLWDYLKDVVDVVWDQTKDAVAKGQSGDDWKLAVIKSAMDKFEADWDKHEVKPLTPEQLDTAESEIVNTMTRAMNAVTTTAGDK